MRRLACTPVLLLCISHSALFAAPSNAREQSLPVQGGLTRILLPEDRLLLDWSTYQSDENGSFERTSTVRAIGEYAFASYASVFASIPYTRRMDPDEGKREHLDTASLGLRLGTRLGRSFYPAAALEIGFATGNQDRGIGHKRLGFMEPRLGFIWAPAGARWFYLATAFRWQSQTNSRFRETETERFERTWFWEAETGLRLDDLDLYFEFQRKGRIRPDDNRLHASTLAPGLRFRPDPAFHISVAVPLSMASEREFERGIIVRATLRPGLW